MTMNGISAIMHGHSCALVSFAMLFLFSSVVRAAQQVPLGWKVPGQPDVDPVEFSPLQDLRVLSEERFATLGHPAFPNYNVRIKRSTDFCDGGVDAYTGYIDIEARHLFFYFFESRSDPDKDDVIFWTNGGPGCSSAMGLFMELGPCRVVQSDSKTLYNPHSWNSNANVFFIDQPIGVGFSYAEYGESVSTTEEAAKDIAAFVAIFFEHFTKFKGRAFHMAGESYGGRYIPVFAAAVYDQNPKLIASGITPINLTSIMIGNGCTDWYTMLKPYYEMQCKDIAVSPIIPISSCVRMEQILPRCEKLFTKVCSDTFDAINCRAALAFCEGEIYAPFLSSGYNPYDLSKKCDGSLSDTLCYPITKNISAYLDRPDIREAIGVDPSITSNFTSCSDEIGNAFQAAMDFAFPTQFYIAALLERGVRTLLYIGANDWICNWVGNERMSLALEWTGQDAFNSKPLRDWTVDGKVAGVTRRAGPFTFATVAGAGHMVPYDKPKESLEMLKRWLAGEEL